MAEQAARTRADAVNGFAAVLRDLRASAGNPSFRELAGRSHAISHTTLHEAAQGNRFPSWATTVEFVKACGADPGEYRERWEQANRAIRTPAGPGPAAPPPDPGPATADPGPGAEEQATAADAPPPPAGLRPSGPSGPSAGRPRRRFTVPALAGAGVLAVAAAVVITVLAVRGSGTPGATPGAGDGSSPPATLSANQCPVHPSNPPPAPPAHPGDAGDFIDDITLPDCTHIRRGSVVRKVWRLKNSGTVEWKGYSLHRLDAPQQRNECQTIADIPIRDTKPGAVVDVSTEITAPDQPAFCFARFKLVDATGHTAFPAGRPLNFQLIVD